MSVIVAAAEPVGAAAETEFCKLSSPASKTRGAGELAATRTTRNPFDSPSNLSFPTDSVWRGGNKGTVMSTLQLPFAGKQNKGTTPVETSWFLFAKSASYTSSTTSHAPGRLGTVKVSPAPRPHTGSRLRLMVSVFPNSLGSPLSKESFTKASVLRPTSEALKCFPATTHTCTCLVSLERVVLLGEARITVLLLQEVATVVWPVPLRTPGTGFESRLGLSFVFVSTLFACAVSTLFASRRSARYPAAAVFAFVAPNFPGLKW
mmetsp:Transcript_12875/g.48140  ORF Transcript_12875/g.48140 Transcript_12875/m.48140 type:complete len:262 (+) Transcript_12875:1527-2312(+)